MKRTEDREGLPKHVPPKSRTQIWKENNRDRYNEYQKQYMRAYRARRKAEAEDVEEP